ncbi:MAG: hypothetical protein WC697_02385 [Patescibacteria group bacterium]|jgi:hypothetical protein
MGKPKFGEQFPIDSTNRLDVLKNQDLPEYIDFIREVRLKLKESIEKDGWPECPKNIESIDKFFDLAKNTVNERWKDFVFSALQDKSAEWANKIPENKEYKEIKKILSDPDKLDENLALKQFEILEPLREIIPEAWRTLVLASSEQQLAAIVLSREWSKKLTDENFSKMGINKSELDLFLDAAGILGKYFDQAYVKQIELADAPGGKEETSLKNIDGAERVYDIYNSKKDKGIDLKPYCDVFPFEWPKIVSRFQVLADKTDQLLQEGKIPETYKNLPAYFKNLADVYGSDNIDIKELNKKWEKLSRQGMELSESGCPIMLLSQGAASVTGDAGKVDVEIRLGFKTKETIKLEKIFEEFQNIAQKMVNDNQDKLEKPYKVPKMVLNIQPFAFGPNLYSMTQGESGDGTMVSHINTIREATHFKDLPLLKKIFPSIDINPDQYERAAVIETVAHEFGHTILSEEDDKVLKRVGTRTVTEILNESKAETMGMNVIKQSSNPEINLKTQFWAKIGVICNYLANSSSKAGSGSERYYYSGITMISKLLAEGIIKEKNKGYDETINFSKGIELISEMGINILDKFHGNSDQTPQEIQEHIKEYIKEIKAKEKDGQVKHFLEMLKA